MEDPDQGGDGGGHLRPVAPMPSPHGGASRGGRFLGGRRVADAELAGDSYTKDCLPPPMEHELEFVVRDALNYSSGEKIRSEPMVVRNFRFRVLVFPAGTVNAGGAVVSAFVEADPLEGLDPRWMFSSVKYQVALVNWLDYRRSSVKRDTWSFSKEGIDRGWHDIVRCAELSQESGWLGPENSLLFRACVCVRQADGFLPGNDYNPRKETGYVGLMNHGATCYMNGLLQSLFHAGEFRRIVYSIDCDKPQDNGTEVKNGDEVGNPTLIQALQKVFYNLQTAETAVNCKELMKSFGWDSTDAFTQHDAQELNRILCDRLEEQMKGSDQDGTIKRLFEGEMENYIECLDVEYTSKRTETFYDIQLNIKSEKGHDLHNIEASLREFTADEMLDGDNLYEAEGHGRQRAKKGIRFLRFPPVLNLQLKRFHFDMERMDMVKLNSRFEIPRRLDLSSHAPGAGMYLLHSVVVHSGDVNSGHYYAYIRPNLDDRWVKFDDDNVTPCSEYAAVEDNFGGWDLNVWNYFEQRSNNEPPKRARIHNAYMLVYIREDSAADVLHVPDPMEVNKRMVERCNAEVRLAEQRRREKLESQTKVRINLVFEPHLTSMPGFWDSAHIPAGHSVKMNRDQTAQDLIVAAETVLQVPQANLVCFALHQRTSSRFSHMPPNSVLKDHIPSTASSDTCLAVLCVAARGFEPIAPPLTWKGGDKLPDELSGWDDAKAVMLIVKYFCRQTVKLVTLGCYYSLRDQALASMIKESWLSERLRPYLDRGEVAPLPPQMEDPSIDSLWDCWEEVREREVRHVNSKKTAIGERLMSGDILVWQQPAPPPEKGISLKPGEVAPVYSVNTVADLAEHYLNSIDVTVTLHDRRQPLFVGGVVMNGNYGPIRPAQDAKAAASKQETPEEMALSSSLVNFIMPTSKELRMDLRWKQVHVTDFIAQEFSLKHVHTAANPALKSNATFVWLFNSAPSSGQGEEPVNSLTSRASDLKDIQRAAPYVSPVGGKKPLNLHAVEMPFQPGLDKAGQVAIGVRFFDSAVREVGSEVLVLSAAGTVQDLLDMASAVVQADWGISGTLRALEVADGRLHKLHRPSDPLRSLACFGKSNILFHCVRIESDIDVIEADQQLVEVYHCDRSSQQAFGHPLLIKASPGEKAGSFKARCKDRLQVPDAEFKSWRLVRAGTKQGRVHLKDDEPWDSDAHSDALICLEHIHPNPTSSFARTSRYNKPLTIK